MCAGIGTRGLDIIRHRYDDGELAGPATRKTNVRAYRYYDNMTKLWVGAYCRLGREGARTGEL